MSKLEDKTRQLAALREFLEVVAKGGNYVDYRIMQAAEVALKKWDADNERPK
jgi:hypothetical protein